jgi:hypothetical protein
MGYVQCAITDRRRAKGICTMQDVWTAKPLQQRITAQQCDGLGIHTDRFSTGLLIHQRARDLLCTARVHADFFEQLIDQRRLCTKTQC